MGLGGLYDYRARYYDPFLARFISADTIVPEPGNPQSLNRYSYVYNRPLVYVDPDGHLPWWVWAVGGAVFIVGGAVAIDEALVEEGRIAVKHNTAAIEAAADRYGVPPTMVAVGIAAQGNSYQRPFGLDTLEELQMKYQETLAPGNEPSVGIGQIMPSEALKWYESNPWVSEYMKGGTYDPWTDGSLFDPQVSIGFMGAKLAEVDTIGATPRSERDRWMAMMIAQNGGLVLGKLYDKYEGDWSAYLDDSGEWELITRVWAHMHWLKMHGWDVPPDVEAGIDQIVGGQW